MSSTNSINDSQLEWLSFLNLAELEARTEPGRTLVQSWRSSTHWARDLASAKLRQKETQEVLTLIDREGLWGVLTDLQSPESPLSALERSSVLDVKDWVLLRGWLYATESWSQVPLEELRTETLRKALHILPSLHEPLRYLDRILTAEGELSENATPRLASLHQDIRSLKREINVVLDQVIKAYGQRGLLQDQFSDVRDGRFVIPVKISHQGEVEGTFYEASASKQTVFMEPREVSQLNNRLRQKQNDLLTEIFIIMKAATDFVHPFAHEIRLSVQILAHWDAVHARARLGLFYGGKSIQVTEERHFELKQTAHPLLWKSMPSTQIIRNEVEFGDPIRTLLLTGPNTGGKTVFLKTLGLAAICARTGFPFPAVGIPRVPFFDQVFSDLGDAQSIEHHLSSFSGHILKFKQILENLTPASLVLLDELNTATDPEEGAALGRAFLETLIDRGAIVVATTHDPHLKALALHDDRLINASLEFDETSRTPTYRVQVGVPGRSRALETAARLGIPEDVLTLARSYLSSEHLRFEKLLGQLESDASITSKARREAEHLKHEVEQLKKEWTEKTQKSVQELLDRTRTRLKRVVDSAQDEVRMSVRKLEELKTRRTIDQETKAIRGELDESFRQSLTDIDKAFEQEAPSLAKELSLDRTSLSETTTEIEPAATPSEFPVGTTVRIPKWKNTGTILENLAGGKTRVSIGPLGTMQMVLLQSEIELSISNKNINKAHLKAAKMIDVDRPPAPAPQLDLRGVRFELAMSQLEKYLDQAFRSGACVTVTVIHGFGTGAIREGTRKFLSELPYIKAFRDAGTGQGGAGATLVEFEY